MTNTYLFITLAAFFALGVVVGLNLKSVPSKKTRYFVDGDLLRRWKFGHRASSIFGNVMGDWSNSNLKLSELLKDCQEVSPLVAYRMFPMAFKK